MCVHDLKKGMSRRDTHQLVCTESEEEVAKERGMIMTKNDAKGLKKRDSGASGMTKFCILSPHTFSECSPHKDIHAPCSVNVMHVGYFLGMALTSSKNMTE